MEYKVAFDVNGTVHNITCEQTKVGNQYLQCFAETRENDDAKVAFIPFDAVEYIVHEGTTVSTESLDDTGPAQTDEPMTLGDPDQH